MKLLVCECGCGATEHYATVQTKGVFVTPLEGHEKCFNQRYACNKCGAERIFGSTTRPSSEFERERHLDHCVDLFDITSN